jgi:fermentation-respiration switch protein FrsA (DUF1100 family)
VVLRLPSSWRTVSPRSRKCTWTASPTAHQPKELVILPGCHFDAYVKGFDAASGQARDWFTRHLA